VNVGYDDFHTNIDFFGNGAKKRGELFRFRNRSDLCCGTYRDIDENVRSARRLFLGENGSNHLRLRVQFHRPLHGDENVIGRGQLQRSAPRNTSSDFMNDGSQFLRSECDFSQDSHGVGGPRRTGNGA